MGGWRITRASMEAWAEALEARRLGALGVSTEYVVEGPADVDFRRKTLAVDALLADLRVSVTGDAWVLLVAHSSGAHVAATLLRRALRAGEGLRGRFVYVDLDGDRGIAGDPERTLDDASMAMTRRVIFVTPDDPVRGLRGYSRAAMEEGHRRFAARSELLTYDASGAGCATDDCAHLALINTRPSSRGNASYARFDAGPVNTAWLSAAERWLTAPAALVIPSAR